MSYPNNTAINRLGLACGKLVFIKLMFHVKPSIYHGLSLL